MRFQPTLRHSVLPMALLVAACQAAPALAPQAGAEKTIAAGKTGTAAAGIVSSGAGLGGGVAAGAAQAGLAGGAAGAASTAQGGVAGAGANAGANAAGDVLVANPGGGGLTTAATSLRDSLLKDVKPVSLSAAAGGTVQSPDGKVTIVVPPGALSGDTQARLTYVQAPASDYPGVLMSGLRFALDLGGATLAPDQQIKVRGKANPEFVAALQKRDASFAPEKYSLSKDASGEWVMEMVIKGPASVSPAVPTTPLAPADFRLTEFGHLPFAPGPTDSAAPKYSLMLSWAQQQFEKAYGRPAPNNMGEWFAYEGSGLFDCGSIESNCWGMQLLHEMGWGVPEQHCEGQTPPIVQVAVPAQVRYTSDDPSVDGQPAVGAVVTWNLAQSAVNGPAQVVTDGQGKATTYTAENSALSAMAQVNPGPRSGAWVGATATQNMATMQLTAPLMSPNFQLAVLTDGAPLPASLDLKGQLDGAPVSFTVALNAQGARGTGSFRIRVPDNAVHQFSLTGVSSGDFVFKQADPATNAIQRNGEYGVRLTLLGSSAK